MKLGPNQLRVICHRTAQQMVPPGGDIGATVANIAEPGRLQEETKKAVVWVEHAIAAVKSAPNNPYKTDEEICGEILRQLEAKLAAQRAALSKPTNHNTTT